MQEHRYSDLRPLLEDRIAFHLAEQHERWMNRFRNAQIDIPSLFPALSYATKSGKRVRPLLLLSSYCAFVGDDARRALQEGRDTAVLDLAAALEMIHAYSLVHDDLPAMDNDVLRRGEPTVHVRFGEGNAILAGDALLNLAYETMLGAICRIPEEPCRNRLLRAGEQIASLAGVQGMIGGQVLDLASEVLGEPDVVRTMVEMKTGALILAACRAGAIAAGAEAEARQAISSYALHLGIAFQAQDDLFDREQDRKIDKKTLIRTMSARDAEQFVQDEFQKAFKALNGVTRSQELVELTRALQKRQF